MAPSLNLSRASPFGSLSQVSSRRTFAYLVATLNASHEDYDFSHLLKPSDFKRQRSILPAMNTLDTTLYNLRPRHINTDRPKHWTCTVSPTGPAAIGGGETWSPRMWKLVDSEMDLKSCSVYSCEPEEDIWDLEDGALWTYHYFFFNKKMKRVCYIWLQGSSMMSYSPAPIIQTPKKHKRVGSDWSVGYGSGSSKRAKYWLGEKATRVEREWGEDYDECEGIPVEEEDDDEITIVRNDEEEVEDEVEEAEGKEEKENEFVGKKAKKNQAKSVEVDNTEVENTDETGEEEPELSPTPSKEKSRSKSKSPVRGISEDVVESMEI